MYVCHNILSLTCTSLHVRSYVSLVQASYWCKHSLQVNFLELSVVHRLVDVYVPSLRVKYSSWSSAKFQAKLLASVMKE